jgi:hypothetical protein
MQRSPLLSVAGTATVRRLDVAPQGLRDGGRGVWARETSSTGGKPAGAQLVELAAELPHGAVEARALRADRIRRADAAPQECENAEQLALARLAALVREQGSERRGPGGA